MSVQLEKKSKQQSNKTSASMEITCALYQTEACPFPTTCDGKNRQCNAWKDHSRANKPQKALEMRAFYSMHFSKMLHILCVLHINLIYL